MKVYVVCTFLEEYGIQYLEKAFFDEEKAEAFADDMLKHSSEDYSIEEVEVER